MSDKRLKAVVNKEQQAQLRAPFPKEKIQKLDAGYAKLDYVSHAWVTDRLLEVDPAWTWEPAAFDQDGLPKFDENGGLWIKLTVCGVTRFGYGEPQGRDKFDMKKGAIGNALRNAAMRFGIALDLWAKEVPGESPKVNKELEPLIAMIHATQSLSEIVSLKEVIAPKVEKLNEDDRRNLGLIYNIQKAKFEQ
jgi:hypothetical protein